MINKRKTKNNDNDEGDNEGGNKYDDDHHHKYFSQYLFYLQMMKRCVSIFLRMIPRDAFISFQR